MKTLALLTILGLGFAGQGTIDFKPKVGDKNTYAVLATLDIGGQEAQIVANLELSTKKADDKMTEVGGKWSDLKIEVGGSEIPVDVSDSTFELTSTWQPTKVTGGIDGSDPVQFFLVTRFIPPTEKELTAGMKYKVDVKEVKDQMPEFTYEGEYVGKETLNGKTVHRFKAELKGKKEDSLSAKQTILVREDGVVQKVESEFKNMDVPAANNGKANGKSSLTLK
ncbi:MAG: hypothetical protein ACAH95_10830 [Fimbriimonas sp.]